MNEDRPTIQEVEKVLPTVIAFDPGVVLLYGSVAKGLARPDSDIDLAVIFDDLEDYSQQYSLSFDITEALYKKTDWPVNAHVVDRPLWKARLKCVSSFERHVSSYALEMYSRPARKPYLTKTLKQPITDKELALASLRNLLQYLWRLFRCKEMSSYRGHNVDVCVMGQRCISLAIEGVKQSIPAPHIPKMTLDLGSSLRELPLADDLRNLLAAATDGVLDADIAMWRKVGTEDIAWVEDSLLDVATDSYTESFIQAVLKFVSAAVTSIDSFIGQTDQSFFVQKALQQPNSSHIGNCWVEFKNLSTTKINPQQQQVALEATDLV